nr:MAG TPA: hypothetical protein [Caudoviricetes sp.]
MTEPDTVNPITSVTSPDSLVTTPSANAMCT